jgi:3-oxoacyl-[acyl-carrier protein] reductase
MQNNQPPIAIVTGASRQHGIGAAICQRLAHMGIDIFFTYWSEHDQALYNEEEDGPQILQAALEASGVRCAHIEQNLIDPLASHFILDAVETRLGPPSILVNNAAHDDTSAPFSEITATVLDTYYAANMRGPILLSCEFARRFSSGRPGRIINLTSGQSVGAMPGKIPYISTKGAIDAFTVTFAAEVAAKNITVNAVDPGPTDTGWISADPDLKQSLLARAPFGRLGQPEDVANLVAFLAGEDAAWITGQILHSRGGF